MRQCHWADYKIFPSNVRNIISFAYLCSRIKVVLPHKAVRPKYQRHLQQKPILRGSGMYFRNQSEVLGPGEMTTASESSPLFLSA